MVVQGGVLFYPVVCTVAFVVAALTLFSGFGLGTLVMPAFALFFPVPTAIAATAVVHLANNVFKLTLVGRHADRGVVLRFGLPGVIGAMLGAETLGVAADIPPLARYVLAGQGHEVSVVKLVIAALMMAAAFLEISPRFSSLAFTSRHLALGGLLSGFFGGLSGHQGALRSAFLVKAGLEKQAFIGTGVVSAVMVDLTRLLVYGSGRLGAPAAGTARPVAAATLAAFLGSFVGSRLLDKVTSHSIQLLVGGLLVVVGLLLAAGLV